MLTYIWDEQRLQKLQTLYQDGMSFALIAADIGVSRNAVIGKVHRLNLPKRDVTTSSTSSRPSTRKPAVKKSAVVKPAPPPAPVVVIEPGRDYCCAIIELDDQTCRYPLWDTNAQHHERFYCGRPGASLSTGFPYCQRHAAICGGRSPDNA